MINIDETKIKHIPFPSIEQFRKVVKHVRSKSAYVGKDENGKPTYDGTRPIPTLLFCGTVKLHGTNASVCQSNGERWFQSRSRIISITEDNMGFAFWAETKKESFDIIFSKFCNDKTISVFGEWCGIGIQKGVAISELQKQFIIFAIKIDGEWLTRDELKMSVSGSGLPTIYDFQTYHMLIDFSNPEEAQNELVRITEEVEQRCPVGHALGVDGVGEGVVWSCVDENWLGDGSVMWFKVKGEKHSVTKVKTLASIDVEKVNSVKECVEKICTENRMKQALQKIKEQVLDTDIKNMGCFLRFLASDCIREELDTIVESGLEPKDVGKAISDKGRKWFMNKINYEDAQ